MHKFHTTDKTVGAGFYVLEYDNEGPFKGIQWTYGALQMGDTENEDGSMTMRFDWDQYPTSTLNEDQQTEFGQITGEILMQILEEQVEKNEVQFKGGV